MAYILEGNKVFSFTFFLLNFDTMQLRQHAIFIELFVYHTYTISHIYRMYM